MELMPEVNREYFETIIFDLDGVIIDSAPGIYSAVQRTLAYLGSEPREYEYIKGCIDGGVRSVFVKALGETQKGLIKEAVRYFKEYYWENCFEQIRLYSGAAEILNYYSDTKKIALTTFRNRPSTEKILAKLKVLHYFDEIVTADDVAFPRPDPQCIQIILTELVCRKEGTLLVGDTATDLLTGKNAGIKTCGVLYGIGTEVEIKEAQPDYLISSMRQLGEIIL